MTRALWAFPLLIGTLAAQTPAAKAPMEPSMQLYTDRCSVCHGDNLEGGRGPTLAGKDKKWTYGGDDVSVATTIREGRAGGDMPAFKDQLSDAQIRTLVLLIRDRALRSQGRPNTTPTVAVNGVIKSELVSFKMETIAEQLMTPWGIEFLPDGRILVSERPGRLRIIEKGKLLPSIEGTPRTWNRQDGGYFDIAVHPDYARNGWIYLGYSEPGPNNTSLTEPGPTNTSATKVVRGRIKEGKWVDQETIFQTPAELYSASNAHYGLRFIFDKQNHLFFSIGDRARAESAQDINVPVGKVFRVMDDGKAPADNPFVKEAGGKTAGAPAIVWSYGHRNPEGFAFHPVTGKLWETEHGPRGGDEVNIVYPAHNYGWPVVTYGIRDNGQIGSGSATEATSKEGMDSPVWHWEPSPGISPMMFYTGDKFPEWKNQLFAGAMGHEQLKRLILDGEKVTREEVVFHGLGRVRDVVTGPDGYIYLALQEAGPSLSTDTPGKIVRLVPAK